MRAISVVGVLVCCAAVSAASGSKHSETWARWEVAARSRVRQNRRLQSSNSTASPFANATVTPDANATVTASPSPPAVSNATATASASASAAANATASASPSGSPVPVLPSPSPASGYPYGLPPACDPLLSPVSVISTSGTIRLGVPAPVKGRQLRAGRRVALDAPVDDTDDYAEPSAFPSLVPGVSPFLPVGTTCEWLLDGGDGQSWDLSWSFVSLSPGDGGNLCANALNVITLLDGGFSGDLIDLQCDYTGTWPLNVSSRTSSVLISMAVEEAAMATGFQLQFALHGGAPNPSPSSSAAPSPAPGGSPLPSPTASPAVDANCTLSLWSGWGNCSVTCGGGLQTRTRTVVAPATGAGICWPLEETQPCNVVSCAPTSPDVDCVVSNWTAWGSCELGAGLTCGSGTHSRTRTVITSASGKGAQCPPPADMVQQEPCTVPCLLAACDRASRPTKPAAPAGSIGIGNHTGSSTPPRYDGNTECEWLLDPALMGAGGGSGAASMVNVTIGWLDVPLTAECSTQYLQVTHASSGEAATVKLCGSALPRPPFVLSRPGEGLRIKLITVDGVADTRAGFGASYALVSAAAGPSPPPAGPASTASLSFRGNSLWAAYDPSTLVDIARTDLSDAAGAAEYRFTGFSYTPARQQGGVGVPPELTVQVVPPLAGGRRRALSTMRGAGAGVGSSDTVEPSVYEIVTSLYSQLHNPQSRLMQGTVTRGLDASTFAVSYGTPAAVAFLPAAMVVDVPYNHPPSGTVVAQLKVVNMGGSPLVISAAEFTYAGGSGSDPSTAPYGTNLLSLTPAPSWPLSLPGTAAPPHAESTLTVAVDLSKIPAGSSVTAFAVLQLEHNDATGPHAVPVTVRISGAPSPQPSGGGSGTPDDVASLLQSQTFRIGAAVGAGSLFFSCFMVCCSYCCCCRRNADGVTLCGRLCGKKGSKARPGAKKGSSGGSSDNSVSSPPGTSSKGPKRGKADLELDLSDDSGSEGETSKKRHKVSSKDKRKDASDSEDEGERRGLTDSGKSSSKRKDQELALELTKLGSSKRDGSSGKPGGDNDIGRGSTAITRSGQITGFGGTGLSFTTGSGGAAAFSSGGGGGGGGLFGGLETKPAPSGASSASMSFTSSSGGAGSGFSAASSAVTVQLKPKPLLKAKDFEGLWSSLLVHELWGISLQRQFQAGELEKALQPVHVSCLASGPVGDVTKYYVYGMEDSAAASYALAEVSVDSKTKRLSALVKGEPRVAAALLDAVKRCLQGMGITTGN